MSTIFDFSNVKSISIPEGEVKQMEYETSGGTDVPVWSGEWSLTIALGNCVTKVKYKIGSGSWVNITSTTILTELDTDATVYIQAVEYEDDTNRYNYTNHNFDVSKTSDNDGETVTVYRDKETRYYTSSVTVGNYVQTVKIKKNSEAWSSAQSSVSITHIYDDTVYWEAVDYNENTTSGNTRWLYDGTLSGSFTQVGAKTITCSQTQTIQYNVTIKANRCSANYSSGWINADTTVTWTCASNRAFNSTGTKTTDTASITGEGTYEKSANYVNATAYNGTNCSVASGTTTGWKSYTTKITWNADTGYAFANNATSTTTDIIPGNNTCTASNTRYYTITFAKGGSNYGSWGSTSKTAYHGDTLSRSGDTVTCKNGSTTRWTNAFTNGSATGYDYSVSYSDISSPVTDAQTITATTSRSKKKYTVTWKNHDGTVLETDYNVEYQDTPTYDGSTPTKEADNYNTYDFSGWYPTVGAITGDTTYTAQFSSNTRYFTTTIQAGSNVSTLKANVNGGTWTSTASSVSISHTYTDTINWQLVSYSSGSSYPYYNNGQRIYYTGDTYGSITNSTGGTYTRSITRNSEYTDAELSVVSTYKYYYYNIINMQTEYTSGLNSSKSIGGGGSGWNLYYNNGYMMELQRLIDAPRTFSSSVTNMYFNGKSYSRVGIDWSRSGNYATYTVDSSVYINEGYLQYSTNGGSSWTTFRDIYGNGNFSFSMSSGRLYRIYIEDIDRGNNLGWRQASIGLSSGPGFQSFSNGMHLISNSTYAFTKTFYLMYDAGVCYGKVFRGW